MRFLSFGAAFDLALGLRIARFAEHAPCPVLHPVGEIAGDVTRSVVADSRGLCTTFALSQPEAVNASSSVPVTSSAPSSWPAPAMVKRE